MAIAYNDEINVLPAGLNAPQNKEELEKYYKNSYEFTEKEVKIVNDCFDDAYYTRGVPLALGLGLFANFAVHNGYIKPHRVFGSLPVAFIGATCGILLGVFSAKGACYDKLRKTPDSMYGRYLQHKKYGQYEFEYESLRARSNGEYTSIGSSDNFVQPNALDLNEFRPFPNDDAVENIQDSDQPKPSFVTTYQQLRKKNRDAYANSVEFKYDRVVNESGGDNMRRILRSEPKKLTEAERMNSSILEENNKYDDHWTR